MSDRIKGSTLRDEYATTRNLIANYSLDIKLTKAHLLNSGAVPEFVVNIPIYSPFLLYYL